MTARAPVSLRLSLAVLFLLGACGDGTEKGTTLPGRSRPLLEHDWPHPRDYAFEPSSFRPPDTEMLETPSGLRAHWVVDPSDSLVRITAAVPIGRHFERDGESGASDALTRALTNVSRGSPPLSLRLESLGSNLEAEPDVGE